ncbi:MAG TPA: hypothetical protein VLJ37_08390 [bacterium]|nr:hypothetical protein [bacterium]
MSTPVNPLGLIPLQTGVLQVSSLPPLLLVTLMPDDSGSITQYGNAPAIRRGHNEYLKGFAQSPANVQVRTRYLNGTELFGFSKPKDAVRMDEGNYNPNQGTPLFDQTFAVLQEVLSAAAVYADRHRDHDVFTMTFVMTDGADQGSRHKGPADVRAVVERMFASGRHVVAGIGVRDGYTDFPKIFRSMGIPEQWIMVLERAEGDIVRGMTHVAHTTRTVADAGSFVQASMTGFTGQPGGPAAPRAPRAQPAAPATAMPGGTSVGNMMGAQLRRDPEEIGGVPPQSLPWEPAPMAHLWDGMDKDSGAVQALPTPLRWNAAVGFHSLSLPSEDLVYVLGRDGGQNEPAVRERIRKALEVMRKKNLNLRLMYVPIRDRRTASPVSRMHALIGSKGGGLYTITALDGDVTVITGDDPASDIYRQGKKGEKEFLDRGNLVKLSSGVVIRIL